MTKSLSRIIQFLKLVLVAFLMALLVNMGISVAHRPHDVVTHIELSPNYQQDQTVLIVVRNNLYRSSDGGISWQRITQGLDYSSFSITDLEFSRQNDGLAFLGTEGDGIYRSSDKGLTWQNTSEGLDELVIDYISVSPTSSKIVLASISDRLYLTQNSGDSWQQVFQSKNPIQALGFSNDGKLVIAANTNELLVSRDSGKTWQERERTASGLPLDTPIVAIESMVGQTVGSMWLATETQGIFQTTDQGKTWTKQANPIANEIVQDLKIIPSSQNEPQLFVSTANTGLFYLDGQEWQPRTQGLKTDVQAQQMKQPNFTQLEFSPDGSVTFLAGFDGLFKSEDRGQKWQDLETILRSTVVAMAVSNDSTLATVDYVGNINLSKDGGKTWKIAQKGLQLPWFTGNFESVEPNYDPRRYFDVAFSPNYDQDQTLWASLLWTKVATSQDGGISWLVSSMPKEERGLTIGVSPDFSNDKNVYTLAQSGNIYQSQNGGQDFKKVGEVPSLRGNYGPSIVLSPNFASDRTIYVTGNKGIYQSTDGGKNWEAITENIALAQAGKMQIVISPGFAQDKTLFVSTRDQGLFKSQDGGKTWNQQFTIPGIDTNSPALEAIAISPNYDNDQTLVVSVQGFGLYKSENGGQSFKQITDASLPASRISTVPSSGKPIVFSPNYINDRTIYSFGSAISEIFELTNDGKSHENLAIQNYESMGEADFLSNFRVVLYVYQSLLKKVVVLLVAIVGGIVIYRKLIRTNILSFHQPQVHQYQQREPSIQMSWKVLIVAILVLRILFSFANLDQKPYNADEVRGFYRIAGYNRDQIVEEVFNGKIISAEKILTYQVPTSAKGLPDTMSALAGNSEHTPLYYLLSRFVISTFKTPFAARVLSVILGFACLPAVYWLCYELFGSRSVGWMAVGLISVSPYQILLSQASRQYSLFGLATLICTIALLRAMRKNDKLSWVICTLTFIVGLYSHLFFVFVAFGYCLYLLSLGLKEIRAYLVPFIVSLSVAFAAFLPWIIVILTSIDEIQEKTQWVSSRNSNISILIKGLLNSLGDSFLNWNNSVPKIESYFGYLIFGLVVISLYFLIRFTPRKVWSLVVISIALTPLVLVTADLIFGGGRSLQSRYLLPSILFMQISVAYFLAKCMIFTFPAWEKFLWRSAYLAMVFVGIISAIAITKTPGWDYLEQGKTANALNIEMAPLINVANHPIVISQASHSFVLGLSHLVNKDVEFQLVNDLEATEFSTYFNIPELAEKYEEVFIYFPDQQFKSFVENQRGVELEPVFDTKLYRL
ncbi:YCF48-related protein [Okeania sp.]|uniref:VPS10 domain-containing protein n=1 Tax=Okeania sp. TaxID=3100323 RepID=UPI002B4ADFB2|nr:YCF48-related protein [Okeania sp.]MEB3342485.1 YCF48-related protein [Okeania sp.]